jgi:uncharacterized protein (DUF2164 family)
MAISFKGMHKSKTFWAAIVQFLTAVTAFALGDLTLWMLILDFVAMLGVIFYRQELETNLRNFLNKFEWWKNKTVWLAIASALGFVSSWLAGAIELLPMLVSVFTALVGIFVKSGSSTPEEQTQ